MNIKEKEELLEQITDTREFLHDLLHDLGEQYLHAITIISRLAETGEEARNIAKQGLSELQSMKGKE